MTPDPHAIPLPEAIALTAAWRAAHPGGFKAARFDRVAFDKLLAKQGAEGIRIYMGLKPDGHWTFVMVATDKADKDIITTQAKMMAGADAGGDGDTEEEPIPCPPNCDDGSPLNGGDPPP